jgi:hypothetical protein
LALAQVGVFLSETRKSSASMPSLANGAITPCPGQRLMNTRDENVIAASRVASKPGFLVLAYP